MSSPVRRSRKQRQENSDENHASNDSGYYSVPDMHVLWAPYNPHTKKLGRFGAVSITEEMQPFLPIRSYPILEGHPFIEKWKTHRLQVHKILADANLAWNSISILRRRQEETEEVPVRDDTTMVVSALRNKWGSDFEAAVQKCAELLGSWVELVDQTTTLIAGGSGGGSSTSSELHNIRPSAGASIGVAELDWSSGTLGGYVELSRGSERIICALTNHHVSRPTKRDNSQSDKYDAQLGIKGTFHPAVRFNHGRYLPMSQPSAGDHQSAMESLLAYIASIEVVMKRNDSKASYGDEKAIRNIEECKSKIANAEKNIQALKAFKLDFGTLWASSGFQQSPRTKGALDWALIRVNKDRIGENSLVDVRKKAKKETLRADITATFEDLPDICTQRDSLDFDNHDDIFVAGIGRLSRERWGKVNRIKTDIKLDEIDGLLEDIIVVGEGQDFAVPGDSGAWVFSPQGKLHGMLYGGPGNGEFGTMVTPISEIIESVRVETGFRMKILGEMD